MAFGSFNPSRPHQMMSDINVTPMVDVMLVLLVIFIITAPMFTHAVKLDLPKAQASAAQPPAGMVTISIDAAGKVYWNNEYLAPPALDKRLAETAAAGDDPELQLRADKDTRYEVVAQVLATAQSHGLGKLAFVTEPVKGKSNGKD
jgi:biopolymer transport protein ExbD